MNDLIKYNPGKQLPGRSAFTPALWLCALITVPTIISTEFVSAWIAIWLLSLTSVVILSTLGIYCFHSIKNQHLLQSEEFLLKRDAITIYGSSEYRGGNVERIVNAEPSTTKTIAYKGDQDD